MGWEEVFNIYRIISQGSLGWEIEAGRFGQLRTGGWEDDKHFLESFRNQAPLGKSLLGVASLLP